MFGQKPKFIRPGDDTLYPVRNKDGAVETLLNPNVDSALSVDSDSKSNFVYNRYHHLPLEAQRQKLPVFQYRNHILYLLEKYQTLVLVGETGCGKSTQVPQYLHEVGHRVCVTQPRVTAAVSLAVRVAQERGEEPGQCVGYAASMTSARGPDTGIVFMTEGVLLREMFASPLLMQYSCIVLDEVHERTQMTDVLMGLLKKIAKKRKNLKLIISSATMDAEFLRDFFNLTDRKERDRKSTSVVMSMQGRTHPIDVFYVEEPVPDYVKSTVDTVIKIHENEPFGDILAFLTSQEEILTALETLQTYAEQCNDQNKFRKHFPSGMQAANMSVLPMYGSLPYYKQIKVFQMGERNVRKVILATNIAETSVTIAGIVYVIDCGFHKLPYFDPSIGVESICVAPISKNNATQRAGRAGRTARGKCYRLYTESEYENLPPCIPPEMSRSDLSAMLLQLKALGIHNVLRYLAAQQSFYDLSLDYLIAPSTLRSIIKVTCDKLWCVLQPLYMAEKEKEDWIKIAKQFNIRAGFPNVIGAIDGKHIRIEKPNNAGSEDFNYKKYFSVVLMAWVDADYKFVFVDIGSYGSSSDSTIFKNSNMGKRLEQGTLNIPSGNTLPGDESGRILPYYVIGDEAFGLSKNILRPYAKRDLNIVKKVFNYRLTRARRFVECTFGILANKWRILHRPVDVNRDFCDSIIKACCILHNYVRVHDGIEFTDTVYDCPLTDYNSNSSAMSSGNDIRQYLCSYFVSPQGSLPWQYEKI